MLIYCYPAAKNPKCLNSFWYHAAVYHLPCPPALPPNWVPCVLCDDSLFLVVLLAYQKRHLRRVSGNGCVAVCIRHPAYRRLRPPYHKPANGCDPTERLGEAPWSVSGRADATRPLGGPVDVPSGTPRCTGRCTGRFRRYPANSQGCSPLPSVLRRGRRPLITVATSAWLGRDADQRRSNRPLNCIWTTISTSIKAGCALLLSSSTSIGLCSQCKVKYQHKYLYH